MTIVVNGKEHEVDRAQSLGDVLRHLSLSSTKGIAVAVNNCVVHNGEWDSHVIREGDRLIIIRATQGG